MDRDDDLPHYPSRDGAAYGCALIGLIAISFWAGVGLTLVGVNLGPGWAIAGAGVILILVALVVAAAGES